MNKLHPRVAQATFKLVGLSIPNLILNFSFKPTQKKTTNKSITF
jgi:hypothetical protein